MGRIDYSTNRNSYRNEVATPGRRMVRSKFSLRNNEITISVLFEQYGGLFSEWEKSFLTSLKNASYNWSKKQKEKVFEITIRAKIRQMKKT